MQFLDKNFRRWVITLDDATCQRIKSATGLSITGETFITIADDPQMIVRVLWCCCEPQADRYGISPEQFAASLHHHKVIVKASQALIAAAAERLSHARI
jgi:hypothetical protein